MRLNEDGVRKVDNATKAELFTYTATVRKVIDGDTLLVALAIAPGYTHQLKLRLRGLDCPELSAAAGRAAKAFVDARLKPGDEVIISTTKPDKYDRYLADVFVGELGARSLEIEFQALRTQLMAFSPAPRRRSSTTPCSKQATPSATTVARRKSEERWSSENCRGFANDPAALG